MNVTLTGPSVLGSYLNPRTRQMSCKSNFYVTQSISAITCTITTFSSIDYLPATLFLCFIICCLVILIMVYRKANYFLDNREGGRDIEHDDLSDGKVVEKQSPTTITYHKLKTFASFDENTSPDDDGDEENHEVEVIEHCTFELSLRYSPESNHLSGCIEEVKGLMDHKSRRVNCVRFHIALKPGKRRIKTGYRSLKDLSIKISFALSNVTLEDLSGSTLRLRLYGRRLEFGVPVTNEKCIGESYIKLDKHVESFSVSGESRTIQAILPKSQQFPSYYDDDLFSYEA